MRQKLLPVALLSTLIATACTSVSYQSPRFADRASRHQTIAVLPFEMIFTGKAPEGLDAEQIGRIEEDESVAFQMALYDSLLDRSDVRWKRPIQIRVQPCEETRRRLDEGGIAIRESWLMPAEELAEILGVDAVVRSRVKKTRYLSDLGSYGIHVGRHVLHEVTEGELDWLIPPGLGKTHDIWAESVLLNGDGGELLWKVAVQRATDWSRPANDVIVGITHKLAKKFPYRA
jgi:hypothetical protein